MAKTNLLIGNGTVLTGLLPRPKIVVIDKTVLPYTLDEARSYLSPALRDIAEQIDKLPTTAKPAGEATAVFTIHPAFLSKWKMPHKAFEKAGLRVLGSKSAWVKPKKMLAKIHQMEINSPPTFTYAETVKPLITC